MGRQRGEVEAALLHIHHAMPHARACKRASFLYVFALSFKHAYALICLRTWVGHTHRWCTYSAGTSTDNFDRNSCLQLSYMTHAQKYHHTG